MTDGLDKHRARRPRFPAQRARRDECREVDVGSGDLAGAICAAAYRNGLVIETSGPKDEVVKVLAPLTTPDAILREGFDILRAATATVTETMKQAAE